MVQKKILSLITNPKMIQSLNYTQLDILARDVRQEIIDVVSKNGGHLSPNLGTVELTIALLKCFDLPNDKIVWDVGHQCYAYKLLTDRKDSFASIRLPGGISGFPKSVESSYDSFISGHASTSIAAAYGIKSALQVTGKKDHVVAVVGDGAMTGGLIYEAINNAGKSKSNLIVILNDNDMSISKSVGALARHLAVLRSSPRYFKIKNMTDVTLSSIPVVGKDIRNMASKLKSAAKQMMYPDTFFEQFGFDYFGPVDGHSIKSLSDVLEQAKLSQRPVLLHIKTTKGKGYLPAEKYSGKYHGVSTFDPQKGIETADEDSDSFSAQFGLELTRLAEKDASICAITAAMESSTGLTPFAKRFKRQGRFFDVGIAEGYAVTFAAGLAAGGCKAVFAVYSTFLQRSYDQLIHDASIEPRNILLAIDRAGIVGSDGETHQGIFDAAFLSTIPGMTVYSPATYEELRTQLYSGLYEHSGPVAIRYPRGAQPVIAEGYTITSATYDHFAAKDNRTVIVTYGRTFAAAAKVGERVGCGVIKLNRILPIDDSAVLAAMGYQNVILVEEGILNGSISMQFATQLCLKGYIGRVKIRAIENFIPQGSVDSILKQLGLDDIGIASLVNEVEQI